MTPLLSDRQLLLLAILIFGSLAAVVAAILRLMIFGRPRGRR